MFTVFLDCIDKYVAINKIHIFLFKKLLQEKRKIYNTIFSKATVPFHVIYHDVENVISKMIQMYLQVLTKKQCAVLNFCAK